VTHLNTLIDPAGSFSVQIDISSGPTHVETAQANDSAGRMCFNIGGSNVSLYPIGSHLTDKAQETLHALIGYQDPGEEWDGIDAIHIRNFRNHGADLYTDYDD
jgi:hypothetical protein